MFIDLGENERFQFFVRTDYQTITMINNYDNNISKLIHVVICKGFWYAYNIIYNTYIQYNSINGFRCNNIDKRTMPIGYGDRVL